MKRQIEIIPIAQPPVQYVVFAEDGKEVAGYALITATVVTPIVIGASNYKEAAIWHIYVDEKYRRKGYARTLIEALQWSFDQIYTQALTDNSKKLLMSTGFVRQDDKDLKMFRWIKGPKIAID